MSKFLGAVRLLLVLVALCASTLSAFAEPLRIFCVGNSFSRDATAFLPQLAKAADKEVEVVIAYKGGASLKQHWEALIADKANPDDAKGKIYDGKNLRELMAPGNWDIITIQQASALSDKVDTYEPYATNLVAYLKEVAPNAEIVMHQTWAYRADDPKFASGKESQQSMYEKSSAAYRAMAEKLGIRRIPVGDAFYKADTDPVWSFKIDTTFDPKTAVAPQLPNQRHSLHVGRYWKTNKDQTKSQVMDGNHASSAGRYLGACVWLEKLTGINPVGNSFLPKNFDPEYAAFLQKTAHEAVTASNAK